MQKLQCATQYIFTNVYTHESPTRILETSVLHPLSRYPNLKYAVWTSLSTDYHCLSLNFIWIKSYSIVLYLASFMQHCIVSVKFTTLLGVVVVLFFIVT